MGTVAGEVWGNEAYQGGRHTPVVYKEGHLGAALLGYTPVGVAALVGGYGGLAVLGGAVAVALATLPDQDMRVPFVSHRGITHTVWFALAVGGVLAGVGWVTGETLGPRHVVAGFGFAVGSLTVASHVAADAITPMGVTPLTPLSDSHYSLGLATADNTIANYLLLAVGLLVAAAAFLLTTRFLV